MFLFTTTLYIHFFMFYAQQRFKKQLSTLAMTQIHLKDHCVVKQASLFGSCTPQRVGHTEAAQ